MIEEAWKRIEAWGRKNAPAMLEALNVGASEEQISALESELRMKLPADFRRSLKVHDGESDGWPNKVFADRGAYLGTERIIHEWKQRLAIVEELSDSEEELDQEELSRNGIIVVVGAVKPNMFLKEWIPVMECNGDVFWALDLSPPEGGIVGQVIEVDWEGCSWKVVASSFSELLTSYASSLEAGEDRIVEGLPTKEDET